MFQASNSSALDNDGDATIALGASLLLTSSRYARLWRRSLYIGIFVSLKKSDSASALPNHESPPPSSSSVLYTPLLQSPPPAVSAPPTRTSSSKSSIAIDIDPDNEGDKTDVAKEQRIKNDIARIVKEKDLNSLLELGGVDGVASILAPCHAQGIIDEENHQILETAKPVHGTSFSYILLNCCKRNCYTICMLLISAVLSFATEIKQEGPSYGWHDGVAIVVAVVLLIAFSSVANFWRERKMLKLCKKDKMEFTILRGEERQIVDISDITVGDKVRLERGDKVPADGLLISGGNFGLDEPQNPEIDHQSNPFLLSGSQVFEGGWMLVTSVGDKILVEMQSSMACDSEKKMLLENRIEKPISYIDNLALFISTLVALVILIRLICKQDGNDNGLPEMKGKVSVGSLMKILYRIFFRPQGKVSILTSIITVAILCVQHGMPLMVTISLKYQIDKGVPNQVAEFHDLSACATMGLATVICIDASGGLLCKLIEVSRIWIGEKDISKDVKLATDLHELLQQGVGVSVLAPELSLPLLSDPLVSWAETTWEMDINTFKQNFDILQHRKLDSAREASGVLVRKKFGDNERVLHLHWIGSASTILNMCSQYYDSKGECHAMENQKIKFSEVIKEMKDSGLKPLAFAYRQTEEQEVRHNGLILVALIGLKVALEDLKSAGIKIKLVSEDDIMAVRALACELGMLVEDCIMLEGKELRDLNDTARLEKVDLALVMGGFLPEDKLLMVQCLQKRGHVVAFLGGLTTSAAVLKVADVGIVENPPSTKVARESSGISIKSFSALPPIVRAGRSKYHNIRKFIQLQLTASISGLLITLLTTMSTGESPLTAVQLIWVNMHMFLLGGLMMQMELIGEEQLTYQPSDREQLLLTKEIWKDIVIQVLYQASVSMIFQFGGHVTDSSKEVRTAMIFNTFMLCQVFNHLNVMHLLKKGFKVVLQSYCFSVTLGVCLLMQVLVIQYAKGLADCMRLNATQWAICILVGALSWGFGWALKFLPVVLKTYFASESVGSSFVFTSRRSWFYLSYLGIPFLIVLFFHVPYYIDQRGQTYR